MLALFFEVKPRPEHEATYFELAAKLKPALDASGGLLFLDRSRSLALREASRDALIVLLGCIPWFVLLALVEVFVSPSPDLPVPLKLAVGVALEALFLALAAFPRERDPAHV